MERDAYLRMSLVEDTHWWFVARKKILSSVIHSLNPKPKAAVLELGCGTGGNLNFLSAFGHTSAMETDDDSRAVAIERHPTLDIRGGMAPYKLPFNDERFDLICLFDVLEHIEEDEATLLQIQKLLAPGGKLIITVPAYQWMWSVHDEFLHHKRRYNRKQLRERAVKSGLKPIRLSYFNTLLFPLAAVARFKPGQPKASDSMALPAAPINATLRSIFGVERHLLNYVNLPFGVSLLGIFESA